MSEEQAAGAVSDAFQALLQAVAVRVSAEVLSVTAGGGGVSTMVWRTSFSLASFPEGADAMRATLQSLRRRIETQTAITFSEQLRSDLLARGARPGRNFTVDSLVLEQEVLDENSVENASIGWWWLVIVLVVVGATAMILYALKHAFQPIPPPMIVSNALWELETERWELAEKVIHSPEPPSVPNEWKAQWVASEKAYGSSRFYDLTFGAGGRLEGLGEGPDGPFHVIGAFDTSDGNVRWRESQESGPVVECYGQWDGTRIDGFFCNV